MSDKITIITVKTVQKTISYAILGEWYVLPLVFCNTNGRTYVYTKDQKSNNKIISAINTSLKPGLSMRTTFIR